MQVLQQLEFGDVEGHPFHGNQYKDYEGEVGNRDHITRTELGTLPIAAVKDLLGARGEVPGGHRNRTGEAWDSFVKDIKDNGIKNPIFITVDHGQAPQISEGNHRRDAAVEAGFDHVPVEIKYFGHAEQEGSVHERAITAAGDLPGHPFHGNQWTGGGAGRATKDDGWSPDVFPDKIKDDIFMYSEDAELSPELYEYIQTKSESAPTLYRGMFVSEETEQQLLRELAPHQTATMRMTSWTSDEKVTEKFADPEWPGAAVADSQRGVPIYLQMAGAKGVNIENVVHSEFKPEREWLVPDMRVRGVGIHTENGRTVIHVVPA